MGKHYPDVSTFRTVKRNDEIADLAHSEFKEDLGASLKDYNQIWQEIIVGE